MAVVHLFGPVSHFYHYWRISFADFIASMVSFWITIFVSAEIGIGAAAGWSVVWTMLRSAFVKPTIHQSGSDDSTPLSQSLTKLDSSDGVNGERSEHSGITIPGDTIVIHFNESLFYPNAHRGKASILEAIKLVYVQVSNALTEGRNRSWSVAAEKRVERLRKEHNIALKDKPLAIVVWDFTMVPFIDVTAILALREMKEDIRLHSGKEVQFRIVGMSDRVRQRFLRAKWSLTDLEGWREEGADVVYPSMERAVLDRNNDVIVEEVSIDDEKKMGSEKMV
jgi:sodium-independent sulfate anion transporter 11